MAAWVEALTMSAPSSSTCSFMKPALVMQELIGPEPKPWSIPASQVSPGAELVEPGQGDELDRAGWAACVGDGLVELAADHADHVGVGAEAVGHVVGVFGRDRQAFRAAGGHPHLDG